jgi:hypothetical protein
MTLLVRWNLPWTQDGGSQTLKGALCLLCDGDVEDVLQPWCGSDGSRQSPRAVPPGRRKDEALVPAWHHEELLSGVLYRGMPLGRSPDVSWAHEGDAWVAPPGGEAHTTKIVGDELNVPKANRFAEGESTAC